MSGSLRPSIPYQVLLKFHPPKIVIIYYLDANEKEKFFHEIPIERRMLESVSEEDIANHLYISEDFYFNPSKLKRPQVRIEYKKRSSISIHQ